MFFWAIPAALNMQSFSKWSELRRLNKYLNSTLHDTILRQATRWLRADGNNSRCNRPTLPTFPVKDISKSFS